MPEFWTLLPAEVRAAIVLVALYLLDAIATGTPNPLDNLVVRGLKLLWERRNKNGA